MKDKQDLNVQNLDPTTLIVQKETPLKEMVVDYVGTKLNPESDEITVGQIIEVFASEFPEFVITVAEENWINGYTQALKDVDFARSNKREDESQP
tara:strand:- start:418 stop:702 length:285 start_codon:yes stop_codon:yes gene_type:complete